MHMPLGFDDIPEVVIDYVRQRFSIANDKVTATMHDHPSMHEETLDHLMVMELTASPPAFFAAERIGLSIESHWLGSRWMYGRWEIADIAFFVTLRQGGRQQMRKVALLQTKRLYSNEIDVTALDEADMRIGIGRLVDRSDPLFPLSAQRCFRFDGSSLYGALEADSEQIARIDAYTQEQGIQVYYGLYNPPILPISTAYPAQHPIISSPNELGCRIMPAEDVHRICQSIKARRPSFTDLTLGKPIDQGDAESSHGWRLTIDRSQ